MKKSLQSGVHSQHLRPASRTLVRFDDMAENVTDRVDPAEAAAEGVECYVGLEHLDTESLKIRRWGTPDDVIGQKFRFRKGDIIFGRRRCYQRKLAVAEFDGICSAHAIVLRAKKDTVEKDFLPFFLQSDMFMERALAISVGSLSPTINWRTLRVQEFPLPPRDEQRSIGEILWAAEDNRETYLAAALQSEKLRRTALFAVMSKGIGCADRAHTPLGELPRHWRVAQIRDMGEVLLGRQRSPKYQTGKYSKPYLRVANVFDGFFDLTDVLEMDFDQRDYATYALKPDDILLNEGQSRELVGRCAIWDGQIDRCCFQNTLVRFRAGEDVLPRFAYHYFQYAFYKGIFASVARQTTSIAHLGADRFGKLCMPVPPLGEQETICRQLQNMEEQRDCLRKHLEAVDVMRYNLRERLLDGASHMPVEGLETRSRDRHTEAQGNHCGICNGSPVAPALSPRRKGKGKP